MAENEVATEVVDAAYHIHRALGPGLLESVYEAVLAHELTKRGLFARLPYRFYTMGYLWRLGFERIWLSRIGNCRNQIRRNPSTSTQVKIADVPTVIEQAAGLAYQFLRGSYQRRHHATR